MVFPSLSRLLSYGQGSCLWTSVSIFHPVVRAIFLMIALVRSPLCSKPFLQKKAQTPWLNNQRHAWPGLKWCFRACTPLESPVTLLRSSRTGEFRMPEHTPFTYPSCCSYFHHSLSPPFLLLKLWAIFQDQFKWCSFREVLCHVSDYEWPFPPLHSHSYLSGNFERSPHPIRTLWFGHLCLSPT